MEITGKFLLRCMRHTFIWAFVTSAMYVADHFQHLLPLILFKWIKVVGGCIFTFYFVDLVWIFLYVICDDVFFEDKN